MFWRSKDREVDRLERIRVDLIKRIDELRAALRVSLERQVDGLNEIRALQQN